MPVQPMTLNDGRTMPQLGFGLWEVSDAARVTREALEVGYRMADGAALYGNERECGEGLRASGLPRDEVFVTTKVWNDRHGEEEAVESVRESLGRLGLDRVDLALIHWPAPQQGRFVEAWRGLIRAREEGLATSIGVSNFRPQDLDRIVEETGVVPVLNQIELHPELPQDELRAKHEEMGIVTQSWTPLGKSRTFESPVIQGIASRTGAAPAQVVIAWHLRLGLAVIPRSTNRERLAENLAAADVEITDDDVAAIATLETGYRSGPDPSTF